MRAQRLDGSPIVTTRSAPEVGDNVNGPSLVRAPGWVERPLGRYYLYFAHHRGRSIRLAAADRIEGPWRVHPPGALALADAACLDHVASPDVHVDAARREIRMYFHGVVHHDPATPDPHENALDGTRPFVQRTKLAVSRDGIRFAARPDVLGPSYFRVFSWRGDWYALAMPGIVYRSADGVSGFERGPALFSEAMRHSAVLRRGDRLHVLYSDVGDCPERILHATIDLRPDWGAWRPSPPEVVLEPETGYEGVELPLEPSVRGLAAQPVRQLRDPAVFEEDGSLYLLYAVAGEQGIAVARLSL